MRSLPGIPWPAPLTHVSLGALHLLVGTATVTPWRSFCGVLGPLGLDTEAMDAALVGGKSLREARRLVTCPECRRQLSRAVGAQEHWTLYVTQETILTTVQSF